MLLTLIILPELKHRLIYHFGTGPLGHFERIVEQVGNHGEDKGLYLKVYLFRRIIKTFWIMYLQQSKSVQKAIAMRYKDMRGFFESLLHEFGLPDYFYFSHIHFISNLLYIKLQELEAILNTPKLALTKLILGIPQKFDEHAKKSKVLKNHVDRVFNAFDPHSMGIPDDCLIWKKYCAYRVLPDVLRMIFIDRINNTWYCGPILDKYSLDEVKEINKISDAELEKIMQIVIYHSKDLKMLSEAERIFMINELLKVALVGNETKIFVDNKYFLQCSYLLLNIPVEEVEDFEEIDSIDEAALLLDNSLEPEFNQQYDRFQRIDKIPPEVEFWGHCSNIQAWAELEYDSRILHSNIAFPLLKVLCEAGDVKAKRIFKSEIMKRFVSGILSVQIFLIKGFYLDELSKEEFLTLIRSVDLKKESALFREMIYLINGNLVISEILSCISDEKERKVFVDDLFSNLWYEENYKNCLAFIQILKALDDELLYYVIKVKGCYSSVWERIVDTGDEPRNGHFTRLLLFVVEKIDLEDKNTWVIQDILTYTENFFRL